MSKSEVVEAVVVKSEPAPKAPKPIPMDPAVEAIGKKNGIVQKAWGGIMTAFEWTKSKVGDGLGHIWNGVKRVAGWIKMGAVKVTSFVTFIAAKVWNAVKWPFEQLFGLLFGRKENAKVAAVTA